MTTLPPIYIVDANRTPFLKARGKPGPFAAADLAVYAAREILARQPVKAEDIGEVVTGCMIPSPDEANIGRIIALRLGCGHKVPGYTVQRNCASGMQAIDSALKDLALGRHDVVLAGGTEAMSRAPLLYNDKMVNWFAGMMRCRTMGEKLKHFAKVRPQWIFSPIISLLHGLSDPLSGLSMGQTAEIVADHFGITRDDMDAFSARSHARLAKAIDAGVFKDEITPIFDQAGNLYGEDDGLRRDSTQENLKKLKPFFDKKFGKVTAANSSQVTDGSAFLMLATEAGVKKHGLKPMAVIRDVQWAGVDPDEMGLGPVHASTPILQRHKLGLNDIDFWELNEAFAGQVIGCLRAWNDAEYCKKFLGLDQPLGQLDENKLNIDGGAVAQGHPVGASGARIVQHMVNVLKREKAKLGMATICIGGGQGGAMLIENIEG